MLAIVCCLIGYVVIVGSAILVPGAYSTWSLLLHYPITFFLALNVVYNYAACVVKNPGDSLFRPWSFQFGEVAAVPYACVISSC